MVFIFYLYYITRLLHIILPVTLAFVCYANKDSARVRNLFAPYFQLGGHFGYQEATFPYSSYGKYSSEPFNATVLDRMNYRLCSPVFTGGLVMRKKKRMFKTDLGYFAGVKKMNAVYKGSGKNTDDNVLSLYMNPRSFYYEYNSYIGKSYYRYTDTLNAVVYLGYLDWNILYGRNLGKHLSLITGPRTSMVIHTTF